jgi:hypothetical protein
MEFFSEITCHPEPYTVNELQAILKEGISYEEPCEMGAASFPGVKVLGKVMKRSILSTSSTPVWPPGFSRVRTTETMMPV